MDADDRRLAASIERIAVVARNLRVDAVTGEVVTALSTAGLPAILLKGPSIGRWLYDAATPRGYRDCDLLVAPDDFERAETALAGLGFEQDVDRSALPSGWESHAEEWVRFADGGHVDLHRSITGIGLDAAVAWRLFDSHTETMRVADREVRVLQPALRAVHLVLHAAHHGAASGSVVTDLHRALASADAELWASAARFAHELDAVEAFGAGLRLLPEGAALAERLGLPATTSVETLILASDAPRATLGFARIAAAGDRRAQLKFVLRKIVPPREYMYYRYPGTSQSRRKLALAYGWRPIWLLREAPAAWRAWREVRRQTRG